MQAMQQYIWFESYLSGAPRHGEEHLQRHTQLLGTVDVAIGWRIGNDSLHATSESVNTLNAFLHSLGAC